MKSLGLINKNRKGFTLIEIVVSLAVIGILFSISVVSYGNWKQRTTITQAKSDLSQLATAFEDYKNTNNAYPSDITKLANFKASSGLTITGGSNNGNYFCINVKSVSDNTISYYLTSLNKEAQSGECPAHGWKTIEAGDQHSCAISKDDTVYCWGAGSNGRLGNGSSQDSPKPKPILQGSMPTLKVKSLSVGNNHTCVIGFDDRAYCWGTGGSGQLGNNSTNITYSPIPVSQGTMDSLNVKSISAGGEYTCAVGFDDKAYCWGRNNGYQLGNGNTSNSLTPVALSQGLMSSLSVKSISAGGYHGCAIGFDDRAYCWGSGSWGRLGNGASANSSTPVAVSQGLMDSLSIRSIAAGTGANTCAIGFNNKAYCWGDGTGGRLGNNTTTTSSTPVTVLQGERNSVEVKSISRPSGYHVCLIGIDDDVYCWGANYKGQLGNNSTSFTSSNLVPVRSSSTINPSLGFKNISTGNQNTCIVDISDDAYCFGYNDYGKLGINFFDYHKTPVAVEQGSMPFLSTAIISSGGYFTCSVNTNNTYCWGDGHLNQLGNNSTLYHSNPTATHKGEMQSLNVKTISSGDSHVCAIGFDNRAYCWGRGNNYQLGNGSLTNKPTPVAVSQGEMISYEVKAISSGYTHTCVIGSDDHGYCWGNNSSGQLGNNSTLSSPTPVQIYQGSMPSLNIKAISAKGNVTCAIGFDDKAYCWGDGTSGQLGQSLLENSLSPVAIPQGVMPDPRIKKITIGYSNFVCAIGFDDKAYCWGQQPYGEFGNNSSSSSRTPVATWQGSMTDTKIKDLSAGAFHVCVIGFDDKAYCWGNNSSGQLGDDSNSNRRTPVAVSSSTLNTQRFKKISGGNNHTCAIGYDDRLYCWGNNELGQLGVIKTSLLGHDTPQLILPPQ